MRRALAVAALLALVACASAPTAPEWQRAVVLDREAPASQGGGWRLVLLLDDGRIGVMETTADVWAALPPGTRAWVRKDRGAAWTIWWGEGEPPGKATEPGAEA